MIRPASEQLRNFILLAADASEHSYSAITACLLCGIGACLVFAITQKKKNLGKMPKSVQETFGNKIKDTLLLSDSFFAVTTEGDILVQSISGHSYIWSIVPVGTVSRFAYTYKAGYQMLCFKDTRNQLVDVKNIGFGTRKTIPSQFAFGMGHYEKAEDEKEKLAQFLLQNCPYLRVSA